MFVNLSSHPNQQWSVLQIEEANALAGPIVDFPFPYVPADATPDDVVAMGKSIVELIRAMRPDAVLVQGEFTLTYYLVSSFSAEGIRCLSATSRRHRTQATKSESFEFVRFRDYVAQVTAQQ